MCWRLSSLLNLMSAHFAFGSAKESQADQGGRTDGKALANGRGSVTSSIQAISEATHGLRQAAHLGNAASIVRDRAICVNGEGHGHRAQHAQSTERHAKHAAQAVRDQDGDSKT